MPRQNGASERGYHHGDLRQALISAALSILDAEGVDAVTVRAVARKAGVAHSAPANHFKDRAALLTALAIEVFDALAAEVCNATDLAEESAETRLHAFGQAVVQFAFRYKNRYRLLWRRDSLNPADRQLDACGGALYDRLKMLLADGPRSEKVSVDSQIIAAWSMVHGYVCLRLDGALVAGRDEVTGELREHAILHALIAGICPSRGS
jgi:AcrR family transcriptional regulator